MMEEIKKFVWTEDLVKEWTAWYSLKNERSKKFTMFKDLEEFKKSKEVKKEPLFITEDNVLCYGGEIVYGVAIQGTVSDLICSAKIPFGFDRKRTNRKWFSNEFAAQEYALLNKELFSINDLTKNGFVYAYLTESFDKLKELAKKKLNQ